MADTVNCLDIITDAMVDLGVIAEGEVPNSPQQTLAVRRLNRMIESFDAQPKLCFAYAEVIHELTTQQTNYTIGDASASVQCVFTGAISTVGVLNVTSFTSGALSVGMKFPVVINGASIELTITAAGTAQGGNAASTGIGTYRVNYTGTSIASATYLAWASRPLAIIRAFVRTSSSGGPLDFPVAVLAMDNYALIGLKTLPGPWPRALYYQPTEPVGTIQYWQNPSAGEMHLFCQMQFTLFKSPQDVVTLPPGYYQLLQHGLSLALASAYGKADPQSLALISAMYRKDLEWLKTANKQPQQSSRVDPVIVGRNRVDAGWILYGGFQ